MHKKNKKHALKQAFKKTESEWNPENINQKINQYIDKSLDVSGDKATELQTHFFNLYRGFRGVVYSEFGKTLSKTRLTLSEYTGEYVSIVGIAVLVKKFGDRYKLLLSLPHLEGTVYKNPKTGKVIKNNLPKEREIDSHIWLDLNELNKADESKQNLVLFGELVSIVAKVVPYKGRTSGHTRKRGYKFGLEDITIDKIYTATFKGEVYQANSAYRVINRDTMGLISYSKSQEKYIPIETHALSLPNKLANDSRLKERFGEIDKESLISDLFTVQIYYLDPVFNKKIEDYNNKYPEKAAFQKESKDDK